MKILKAILVLAVAASVLSLGACAQKKETATQTTATTGYTK